MVLQHLQMKQGPFHLQYKGQSKTSSVTDREQNLTCSRYTLII